MGLPGGVNQHQPTQHVIPIVYTSYPRSSEFMGSGTLTHCANIDVMIKRRLHITLSLTPRPQCTNPLCDGPYPIPSRCVACWPPQGRQTKTLKQHRTCTQSKAEQTHSLSRSLRAHPVLTHAARITRRRSAARGASVFAKYQTHFLPYQPQIDPLDYRSSRILSDPSLTGWRMNWTITERWHGRSPSKGRTSCFTCAQWCTGAHAARAGGE